MDKITPSFTYNEGCIPSATYSKWLKNVSQRYQNAQIKASVKVNDVLLRFYWTLGKDIVNMKMEEQWGKGVLNQLSLDLKALFPSQKGFSLTNLKYIKRWFLFYNQSDIIRHQPGDELEMPEKFALVPWRHHVCIFTKSKSIEEAIFYIDKVIEGNWSRSVLEAHIEDNLYANHAKAQTNFAEKLPAAQGLLAEEVLKDPYKLDFLKLKKGFDEHELEEQLANNITRFLLELGHGFAYVGRQMELRMPGGQSFYPDMIFYHIKLKCYVVVELKVVKFIPEFAGKLNFYVSAADHLLRGTDDNPSIGLLICKSKDDTVVKWSFEDISKPIGVSTYQLQEIVNNTIAERKEDIDEISD